MIVTEEEAKMKWCHKTIGREWERCEASQCMAWEWTDGEWQVTALPRSQEPKGSGWECDGPLEFNDESLRWCRRYPDRRGHCGLVE